MIEKKIIDIECLKRFLSNIKEYITYQISNYQYYKPCIIPEINKGGILFDSNNPINLPPQTKR